MGEKRDAVGVRGEGGDDLDGNAASSKRKRKDPRREAADLDQRAMLADPAAFLTAKMGSGWPPGHPVRYCPDPLLSAALDATHPKLGKKLTAKPPALRDSDTRPAASQVLLVLTYSAARATELTRELRRPKYRHHISVSQLYAKHHKLDDQKDYLQAHPWSSAAVGTPHRVQALCEAGALSLDKTALVVVETTPDVKCRRIWDIEPDTLRSFLFDTVAPAKCPILLYSQP